MKRIFIAACIVLFSFGCRSASHISSEAVCGKWDLYAVDTGRNEEEQKQPAVYTFLSDGSYVCRIAGSMKEEVSKGEWEIKEGKLVLRDETNHAAVFTYREDRCPAFSSTGSNEEFFPKGLTFILRKQ